MAWRLFVFGTLKRGFPLHARGLYDATYLGPYKTFECFPLVVAGPRFAPMLFNEPGVGFQVNGELYAVGDPTLARIDKIESLGKRGNLRVPIKVEPIEGGASVSAFAYMKARHLADPVHSGYLKTYDDHRFIAPKRR